MSKGVRKMMLVEARELERMKQKSVRDFNPKLAVLSRLRDEMDTVLRNPALAAAQKVALFTKLMNRFKSLQADCGTNSKVNLSPSAIPRDTNRIQPVPLDDTLTNVFTTTPETETEIDNSTVQSRPNLVRVSESYKQKPSGSFSEYLGSTISKLKNITDFSRKQREELEKIEDYERSSMRATSSPLEVNRTEYRGSKLSRIDDGIDRINQFLDKTSGETKAE